MEEICLYLNLRRILSPHPHSMPTKKPHLLALWLTSSPSLETLFGHKKGPAVGTVADVMRKDMPFLGREEKVVFGFLHTGQVD